MDCFEDLVRSWGDAACQEWGYPKVSSEWLSTISARLPIGVRCSITDAFDDGSLTVVGGHRFVPTGLAERKGPYAFFSRSERSVPAPNWEYFVQVAEYLRVRRAVSARGLRVDFEDDLMDVSVYDQDQVVWCIEVKERTRNLHALVEGMRTISRHVDLDAPDRHNDALRKSKYLLRHGPPYFSAVAIGARLEFSVHYEADGYELAEDLIPYG